MNPIWLLKTPLFKCSGAPPASHMSVCFLRQNRDPGMSAAVYCDGAQGSCRFSSRPLFTLKYVKGRNATELFEHERGAIPATVSIFGVPFEPFNKSAVDSLPISPHHLPTGRIALPCSLPLAGEAWALNPQILIFKFSCVFCALQLLISFSLALYIII